MEARTRRLAVVGAHLDGQPPNHQLPGRGPRLVETTWTASEYRLVSLPGTVPPKPGLSRTPGSGSFVAEVAPPLAIGTLALEGGAEVSGFVCEPWALEGAEDISRHGGWRAYLASGEAARLRG